MRGAFFAPSQDKGEDHVSTWLQEGTTRNSRCKGQVQARSSRAGDMSVDRVAK